MLEAARVLTWCNRRARVRIGGVVKVIRISNSYRFLDPGSKSELQSGTSCPRSNAASLGRRWRGAPTDRGIATISFFCSFLREENPWLSIGVPRPLQSKRVMMTSGSSALSFTSPTDGWVGSITRRQQLWKTEDGTKFANNSIRMPGPASTHRKGAGTGWRDFALNRRLWVILGRLLHQLGHILPLQNPD
jgi:hypothetical protein